MVVFGAFLKLLLCRFSFLLLLHLLLLGRDLPLEFVANLRSLSYTTDILHIMIVTIIVICCRKGRFLIWSVISKYIPTINIASDQKEKQAQKTSLVVICCGTT
jgi:hypothetical protein